MSVDVAGVATIFRDDESTFPVQLHLQRTEIIMNTAEIPAFLVEPAAGMVYRTGGVFFCHHFRNACGIKLSPAFIKRYPHSDGRDIVQVIYGVQTLLLPAFPAFPGATGEQLIMIILRVG